MEHMSCRRSGSQPELGQHTNGPGNCWCVHVLCSCFDKNGIFTLISVLYNEIHGQLLHLIWYTAHMFSQHDGCNGRTFSEHGHAFLCEGLMIPDKCSISSGKGATWHSLTTEKTWVTRWPHVEVVGKKAKLAAAAWETGDIWRHLETGVVTHHLSISNPSWPRCGVETQRNWFRPQRCCWYASLYR